MINDGQLDSTKSGVRQLDKDRSWPTQDHLDQQAKQATHFVLQIRPDFCKA
jgi:hypothetical protein